MDYPTAKSLILQQGATIERSADAVITRLGQGKPPIPGQVTSILLALKVVFESLRGVAQIDRDLAAALYRLSTESRQLFNAGARAGVNWPPLLDEDLTRIAAAVTSIFSDSWQG